MAKMDTIQFRIPHQVKEDFANKCSAEGKTVSEGARSLLEEYLYGEESPLDELEGIFADADEKTSAASLPEPTIDEINDYCSKVRAERASQMLAG